jgi:hypothetical protein
MAQVRIISPDPLAGAYPDQARAIYWERVRRALHEVFGVADADDRTKAYRDIINTSPVWEQVAVYHTEPIDVAADLAGISRQAYSRDQMERYWRITGLPTGEWPRP